MSEHKLFRVNQSAILQNNDGETLILKGPDFWELPGGRLKEDESPFQGILREIREETGIEECNIDRVVHLRLSDSMNTYIVTFFCSTIEKDIMLSDKHTNFKWINRNTINDQEYDFEVTKTLLKRFMPK